MVKESMKETIGRLESERDDARTEVERLKIVRDQLKKQSRERLRQLDEAHVTIERLERELADTRDHHRVLLATARGVAKDHRRACDERDEARTIIRAIASTQQACDDYEGNMDGAIRRGDALCAAIAACRIADTKPPRPQEP